MSKSILITGGCGFVGSNLAIGLKKKYSAYNISVLDNLKRSGSELNINRIKEAGIHFIHGDIRSKEDFEQIGKTNVIIDAAAEPSVLAGLDGGRDYMINTNFNGTANTLEFAFRQKADFIFLSTSRVYPINHIENISYKEEKTRFSIAKKQTFTGISEKGIAENFPMDGFRSLYGATKYGSELLVNEYHSLLGMRTIINRCGVITGPYQMGKIDQGVMVLWVARHFWKKNLSYIGYGGEGKQVRDVLHVDDLLRLVDYQIHNIKKINGETFNIGGGVEKSVSLQELTSLCEKVTGNKIKISKAKENRKADIRIYISDYSKAKRKINWEPKHSIGQMVADIYDWIKSNEKSLEKILK